MGTANVTFRQPTPGPLSTLVATPTTAVADGHSQVTLNIDLLDHSGVPILNTVVNLTSTDAADVFGQASLVMNAQGEATTTLTSTMAAIDTVTAIEPASGQLQTVQITFTTPAPPPTPTTTDYTQSQLSTLLANAVNSTDLTDILKNHVNGAIVETDTGGPYSSAITQVADSKGHNPGMLLLDFSGETVNTNDFSHLSTIIQEVQKPGAESTLTILGSSNEHIYLQSVPTSFAPGYTDFDLILNDTGNDHIVGGTGNDIVQLGGGTDTAVLDGSNDSIQMGSGVNQSVTLSGSNQLIMDGHGNGAIIITTGGVSDIILNGADAGEIVRLGGSNNNTVSIGNGGAGSIAVYGIAATDQLNFADTQANAAITKVSATEETITFADTGQSVDLHFATHAALVGVMANVHWG